MFHKTLRFRLARPVRAPRGGGGGGGGGGGVCVCVGGGVSFTNIWYKGMYRPTGSSSSSPNFKTRYLFGRWL